MNESQIEKSKSRTRFSPWRVLAGVVIGIMILLLLGQLLWVRWPQRQSPRLACMVNLKTLGVFLAIYSENHEHTFPAAERWCDLIVQEFAEDDPNLERCFRCPMGKGGRSDYAMNPLADPNSPPDVVLVFECDPGWNRSGGAELLTTSHHEGKGCNVLFVDGSVKFVKTEEIPLLRWQGEVDENGRQTDPVVRNARRPTTRKELDYWLQNMVWYHRFTTDEIHAATGLDAKAILAVQEESGIVLNTRPERPKDASLLVLPYPGGRHPRIGFLEGAIDPQRETKFSVFTPWDPNSYVVVDVPEAIWSNLGLTYLAHTHIDTIWTKQGITLPKLEWNRRPDGSLDIERTLPNGIAFGVKAVPAKDAVRMEMWLRNGTAQRLTDLRVQICVMPKMAAGFAEQTNENKVFTNPYVACRSTDGKRWIITAWEGCQRPWGNEQCPCFHSDPKFPDLEPGQRHRLRGWLSFYDGDDIQAEFARIEATGWRQAEK
jgi:prepilin-type processing-associated H-X9-DG protein